MMNIGRLDERCCTQLKVREKRQKDPSDHRPESTHADIVSHAVAGLEDGVHMDSPCERLGRDSRFRPRLMGCTDELHGVGDTLDVPDLLPQFSTDCSWILCDESGEMLVVLICQSNAGTKLRSGIG